jgi:nucleotide-binding universal stress UspA family protein
MYQKILVPLDGSKDAEQILPIATHLARTSGCMIVLLHVVSVIYGYGPYLLHPPFEAQTVYSEQAKQAKIYLDRKINVHDFAGISVTSEVMLGDAADAIRAYAQQNSVDLILLSRYGATGWKRWPMGNVAHKITRSSNIPVLVAHQDHDLPTRLYEQSAPIRALIGLDGSDLAEAALIPTAYFVSLLSSSHPGELHLTTVLQTPGAFRKAEHAPLLLPKEHTVTDEQATRYLKSVVKRLESTPIRQLNLHISWSIIRNVDSAQGLIETAEQRKNTHASCDLIALATHGSGILRRWLLGSIADRVLTGTRLSVLIVRPEKVHLPPFEMQEQIYTTNRT